MHPANSNSSTFDGGTPAGWRGARAGLRGLQNWMQSLRYALPRVFSYKARPAALVLSVSAPLPVYRALVVVSIAWQYAFFAPRKSSLYDT